MALTEKQQEEKERKKNCLWFKSAADATVFLNKIHLYRLNILGYVDHNTVIFNRDFTKKEYKKIFPL